MGMIHNMTSKTVQRGEQRRWYNKTVPRVIARAIAQRARVIARVITRVTTMNDITKVVRSRQLPLSAILEAAHSAIDFSNASAETCNT